MNIAWASDEPLKRTLRSWLVWPAAEILSWLRGWMEWGHTEPAGPHPGSGHRYDLATVSAVKVMSAVLVGVAETC